MGGEVYLAEYGRAKTIHFDLVKVDGVDFRVDAVDAGADCIVMTNEAAEGTATNDFVDEGTGYSLVLTAAEMAGARITVYVVDSATKVWLDKAIHIETFGHQSSAHPTLSPYWTNGAVNGGTPSATVFIVDGFTEATDDHLIGGLLTWTSGANLGQSRPIKDYDDTAGTQTVTVAPGFLVAPADNDEFVVAPRPASSAVDWADGERLDTLLDAIPTTAMRGTDSVVTSGPTKAEMDTAHALLATPAQVKTEADNALATETYAEPAQGQPGDTLSIEEKISFIYAALINKVDVDSTLKEFYNAAGTVIWKKTVADDGTNYNEDKGATGP